MTVTQYAKKEFDTNKNEAEHYEVRSFSLDVWTVTRKGKGSETSSNTKDDGRRVVWSKKRCSCRKKTGIPCRHLLRVAIKKNMIDKILLIENVHEWFDSCYLISTLIEAYATPLDAALYVDTNPTNMQSVYVSPDVNTTQSTARVASKMEHVMGKVTGKKRKHCLNCEEFGHDSQRCKLASMTDGDRVSMRELKKQQEQDIPVPIPHHLQYDLSATLPEPAVDATSRSALLIHRALMQKENPYLKEA